MSTQKTLLVIHLHQIIDIDNHLTKYLTSKDIYIKCSLGNKVLKTPAIGKMGIVDEKVTFQYGGEQMFLCELLTKKNSRQVGVSRISLQQIPTQQRAQPNGFRVLNSGRKQIASLGIRNYQYTAISVFELYFSITLSVIFISIVLQSRNSKSKVKVK